MKFCLFTFCLISLASSVTYAATEEDFNSAFYVEQEPKIPIDSKILLIGDSHVGGMNHRFQLLAKQMGYYPIIDSINGSKTNNLLKRLKNNIKIHSPKLIIVESGTNDSVCDKQWIEQHHSLYDDVVKLAKESGAEIVWLSPPAVSSKLQSFNAVKKLILTAIGENFYFDLLNLDLKVSKDSVHLTQEGYNQLSELLWNWLVDKNLVGAGC